MSSMSKNINRYNKKVTSKPCDQTSRRNCRKKSRTSNKYIEGNYLQVNMIYLIYSLCDVTGYLSLRLVEGEWKCHFNNHNLSFKHQRYSNNKTIPLKLATHVCACGGT